MKDIEISQATTLDASVLLRNIVTSFMLFDPLTNHFGLSEDEFSLYLQSIIQTSIKQQLALIAKHAQDGSFVGTVIAYDFAIKEHSLEPSQITYGIRNWLDFFRKTNRSINDYLAKHKVEMKPGLVLCADFLAVDRKYYGAQISRLVDEALFALAKRRGFRFIVGEYTNPCNFYGKKRELGDALEVVDVLVYKDFVNNDGEKPLENAVGECVVTVTDVLA